MTNTNNNTNNKFNLSQRITDIITSQGRMRTWVADKANINEKTFYDKLYNDRMTAYDLLEVSLVLNIDLNELKQHYKKFKEEESNEKSRNMVE